MIIFSTDKKQLKGFTLLELLVVIAIISLLAGIILVSMTSTRQKSRDSRRKLDLAQISLALEEYYDNQSPNKFVVSDTEININGTTDLLTLALSPNYIKNIPLDPQTPNQNYHYQSFNTGLDYRLEAILENLNDPQGEADGTSFVYVIENN